MLLCVIAKCPHKLEPELCGLVKRLDADPLVLPVRAHVIGIRVDRRDAVGRNAALRVYIPSVAPACITGMTGMPGQCFATSRSMRDSNAGVSGDGGLATGGSMTVTFTFSPASLRMTASTSAPGSPGRIRQLTTARASCGSALFAWPASTRRGDARRPKLRVVERRARQPRGGGRIGRHRGDGAHVDRGLAALGRGRPLEGTSASRR